MKRLSRKQAILAVYNELAEKLSHAADVLTKTAHADMSANVLTLCLKNSLRVLRTEIDSAEKKITACYGGVKRAKEKL